MPKTLVDSSHIVSIDYSILNLITGSGNLTVKFKNGKEYEYSGVSKATYAEFLNSPSKGQFLFKNLKGKYVTTVVPGSD